MVTTLLVFARSNLRIDLEVFDEAKGKMICLTCGRLEKNLFKAYCVASILRTVRVDTVWKIVRPLDWGVAACTRHELEFVTFKRSESVLSFGRNMFRKKVDASSMVLNSTSSRTKVGISRKFISPDIQDGPTDKLSRHENFDVDVM